MIYHHPEGVKWLHPQSDNRGPRKDSSVTSSHPPGTAESDMCMSLQPLSVPMYMKGSDVYSFLGPPPTRKDCTGHLLQESVEFCTHKSEDCLSQRIYWRRGTAILWLCAGDWGIAIFILILLKGTESFQGKKATRGPAYTDPRPLSRHGTTLPWKNTWEAE